MRTQLPTNKHFWRTLSFFLAVFLPKCYRFDAFDAFSNLLGRLSDLTKRKLTY